MSLNTKNRNGKIVIQDKAVAMVVEQVVMSSYGVVDMISKSFTDTITQLFNRPVFGKGVRIVVINNKLQIDIYVILKSGLNTDAIKESITSAVKYKIERFTGMIVKNIDINIVGLKI